ncbi:MAG: branched-chain amino acid ABC transporter substrate-binding protein [Betaproteobacteria bacterium]|nr:branched-chain amino acid ABC transporter substrate-binding protein [Betaproteobacteria bacterium]
MVNRSKRNMLTASSAAIAAGAAPAIARAQAKEVKIGLIVPLTGPWARSGDFMRKGAEMAVEDINAAGGIKSMGGARMRLVIIDAGENVEKAKNAAQRMLSQDPDLTGATGAWLSSFTLAITEVTERAELPMLTLSFADTITARGFKYIFQTSITAGQMSTLAVPALVALSKTAGKGIQNVGIISDNTAAPMAFAKPMREGGLGNMGLKLVVDEIFTPPLADASSMIQKVRTARPDLLINLATSLPDFKLTLEKINEVGLGRGRLPIVANSGAIGAPELLNIMGKDILEGVMNITANWGGKGHEKLIADFKTRKGEPWIPQDPMSTYGDMWIFKEACEMAKSGDKKAVASAIRAMDFNGDGPARFFPGGRVKFDDNGRRVGAVLTISQWQNGVPVAVFPESLAVAPAIWPKR